MQQTRIVTPRGEHVMRGPVKLSPYGDDLDLVGAVGDRRVNLALLAVGETVACHLMREGVFDEEPVVTYERTTEGITCTRAGGSFEVWPTTGGWGQSLAFSRYRLQILVDGDVRESWPADTLADCDHYREARIAELSRDYGRHVRLGSSVVETGTIPAPATSPAP